MDTFQVEKKQIQDLKKCNKCGQILKTEHEMGDGNYASSVMIEIPWGYFSKKDGELHKMHLCEECYDEWIRSFLIPVEITENVELL